MSKPLILISNDDGWQARGLYHLIDCAKRYGDVIAVAPDGPRSGQSSAITVNQPLRIRKVEEYGNVPVYAVNGTPVDCVKLGKHVLFPNHNPELMLSGINHGSNAGNNVIYSGTMGAAMEATMLGISAVGFSILDHSADVDFSRVLPFVNDVITKTLQYPLPELTCLNINFPADTTIRGVKVCRSAHGYWSDEYVEYTDPSGKPFYWLSGRFHNLEPDNPDTDEYWLARDFATVVPASPDMTAHHYIPSLTAVYNQE